jgi:hypothetical protein
MPLTKLAVSLGALAVGTALSALPASAQNYYSGNSFDSGGYVTNDNSGVKTGQIGPRAPTTGEPQRWMNEDRGIYDYSDNGGYVTNDDSGVKTGQIGPRAPTIAQPQQRNEQRSVYDYSGQEPAGGHSFTGGNGGAPATQFKYSAGRNANDGGIASAQFNKGEQKTGSASNRQAVRSGTDSYGYRGQGQPPREVSSVNGYTR